MSREAWGVACVCAGFVIANVGFVLLGSKLSDAKSELEATTAKLDKVERQLEESKAEAAKFRKAAFDAEASSSETSHKLTMCQLDAIGKYMDQQCCEKLRQVQ